MILGARKQLNERDEGVVGDTKNFGFGIGYYRRIASLQPTTDDGIYCHKCRSIISLGESFAKTNSKGKPYHITCAKQVHLI